MQSRQERQNLPCAVILTAIAVEFRAVRAHLSNCQEEVHQEGTVYERGTFSSNGQFWQVGIVEIGAGNVEAAVETKRAIDYFKPSVVLFVGVAGGLKDVALGDVVAATKVYGYESGKVIEESFLPRPNVSEVSYTLEQRAKAEARNDDWLQRIEPMPTTKPRALVKAIAAGDKVVSASNSDVYRRLRSNYSDAVAVEMESHGFLKAVRANREINALIIRGISDLIDDKSHADAAGSQEIAARHASAFAFQILAKLNKLNANPDIIETTNNLPQTTDHLIDEVRQYLFNGNYISLDKLVVLEAQALAAIIQGELKDCPWDLYSHNQAQCQQCLEYLEAKSERFVRMLATIVYYGRQEELIKLIAKAFRLIAKKPIPTGWTNEGLYIRLYPLALAICAVFMLEVKKENSRLLRTILDIRFTWNDSQNLKMIEYLLYFFRLTEQVFVVAENDRKYLSIFHIQKTLFRWLDGLLENADAEFWKKEFIQFYSSLYNNGAPHFLTS